MANAKTIDTNERVRALGALAAMAAIPADDPDRKGSEPVFRHRRIVEEVKKAIANKLAAHDVVRVLREEGFISPYRSATWVIDGRKVTVMAAYVQTDKTLKELAARVRTMVPHYDID